MINKFHTRYCSICYRSSRPEVFCKKGVLRNYAKFKGKHLWQSLFFNKVAGEVCDYIKKETLAQVFSCEYFQIFKNAFFMKHLRWLLLLLDEIQNTKKRKTRESKEGIFEKKVREIGWVVLIFIYYTVVFAFLSSIVEVGRW